jgi:hypothetical protein
VPFASLVRSLLVEARSVYKALPHFVWALALVPAVERPHEVGSYGMRRQVAPTEVPADDLLQPVGLGE